MHNASNKYLVVKEFQSAAIAILGLAALIASCNLSCLAQEPGQQTFPSAEAASHTLFLAAQSSNEQALGHILGGGKELVSSGDDAEDRIDRQQFVQKYQQMHRLVRESDGTRVLYVGAENWPFPVPLVSKGSVWYFNEKAGAQEIRFRRMGENEYAAIEICHALIRVSKQAESNTADPVTQFARTLINAHPAPTNSTPTKGEEIQGPLDGYYFRILTAQPTGDIGSDNKARRFTAVAYPAEYRSSGVMTFIVTQNDLVYENDLGPSTAEVVNAMTSWNRTSNWHVAE